MLRLQTDEKINGENGDRFVSKVLYAVIEHALPHCRPYDHSVSMSQDEHARKVKDFQAARRLVEAVFNNPDDLYFYTLRVYGQLPADVRTISEQQGRTLDDVAEEAMRLVKETFPMYERRT